MHEPPHSSLRVLNARLAGQALKRGDGIAIHRPKQLFLQIASACNLDCYMCSEHNRPPEWRHGRGLVALAPELFEKLASQTFEYAEGVTFGVGGEPTISPHFEQFVQRAHESGLRVHLVTNGTRLATESLARTVAERVSYVQISLDGATQPTYERIRRGSSWAHMRSGLRNLNKHRLAMAAQDRTHVTFCFVLMRSNVHELPAFVEMAREFHADAVHAQHVIPVTEDSRDEPLIGEPERYDHFRELALRTAAELGMPLHLPEPYARAEPSTDPPRGAVAPPASSERRCVPCQMPALDLYVLYDGRVYPCCHPFAHRKMLLGDLRTQSFEEIWNGRTARNLRAGLRTGDVPAICRNCSIANDPPPAFEDPLELERSEDLATWYGERDLDPLTSGGALAHALKESSAAIDDHGALGRAASAEVGAQRAHIAQLESDRAGLAAHCANLGVELAGLRAHARNLDAEREGLTAHARNLASELSEHKAATGNGSTAALADEIRAQREHITHLESERGNLRAHCANLEPELAALRAHARNVETERAGLAAHAQNLERELGELHAFVRKLESKRAEWTTH